jgi:hypothetical protein
VYLKLFIKACFAVVFKVFKGFKKKIKKRAELRLFYRKNNKVLIKVIIEGL